MNPWWLAARASGLVAWALLAGSVVWGLALSMRLTRKPKPGWVLDLHRFLGGLAVIYTGVHVGAVVADSYVHFDALDVLVPLHSSWRPGAIAWGIASLYLLVAIEVTSLVKRHVGKRTWRAIHTTSIGLFGFATMHLLTAGSDAHTSGVRWTAASVLGIVVLLLIRRLRGKGAPAAQAVQPA